ncbi:TSUP family transporter [Nocardioides daeguensis]|uniref:Probable membrane transporter protein n=1 Tax=Nocardioides daeguensis TaxID=908359 RepID=A0ABP6URK3_9ACTN|nr:TSUP family transporter [Nocardioides daeguensis]MBV6728265.1 TSUP family transporter [Nocardioides daeguensis]MCR1773074.1 TSUP family transporter [Nocardioides daeguensis]
MSADLYSLGSLVGLLAIAVGAVAQAATGMGFSLVAAPFLAAVMGPRDGVAVTILLAALSSVAPLWGNRAHVDPRAVGRLLVPTLAFTPLVAWAVHDVETRWLALGGGVGVIVATLLLASGLRSPWLRRREAVVAVGAASATLNVVGGVGGPPVGLYVANAGWEAQRARGTLQAFFGIQNLVTAVIVGVVLPDPAQLAALVAGTTAGLLLANRMGLATVRAGILAVSLFGGAWLVWGTV